MTGPAPRPTFPVERTALAWDRTALAVLGNASLLLVRHLRAPSAAALAVAVFALVVMLAVAVLGRRRARRLHDPAARVVAVAEPIVAGVGVALIGVGVLVVLVIGIVQH